MKRAVFVCALAASLTAAAAASARIDGVHLEVAAGASPTFVHDPAYEALSDANLRAERFGADLRVEVAKLGYFRLAPFVSYRAGLDAGSPYGVVDTRLVAHDFAGGLRLRTWFRSWIGAFLEAEGGVTYAAMDADLVDVDGGSPGMRSEYSDEAATWLVGGLLGLELRLPPAIFRRRGVDWLDFGLEVGGGYVRRGELELEPKLEGGDENSLDVADSADWGGVNLSGWVVQAMFTVSLF